MRDGIMISTYHKTTCSDPRQYAERCHTYPESPIPRSEATSGHETLSSTYPHPRKVPCEPINTALSFNPLTTPYSQAQNQDSKTIHDLNES